MSEQELDKQEEQAEPETEAAEAPAQEEQEENQQEEPEKVPYELTAWEDKENCRAEFKVTVPWSAVGEKATQIFEDLRKNAVVDGFRKGKAPLPLLRARFKDAVHDEVIENILPSLVSQIEDEKKVTLASDPEVIERTFNEGESLELALGAEVFHEVELTEDDFKDVDVKVEDVTVSDEDVDKMIEHERMHAATIEPAGDDESYGPGFIIIGKAVPVNKDGEPLPDAKEDDVRIDSDMSEIQEDVMKLLEGKKAGDEVLVPRRNEEGEVDESLGSVKLKITELKKRVKPEVNDEFAQDLDFENLEEYKADVRRQIERRKKREAENKAIDEIVEKVAEKKGIEVPPTAVEQEARSTFIRLFGQSRMSREEAEELLENMRGAAKMSLKRRMILKSIRDKFDIEVTDEDVNERIDEMAKEEGRKPLAIRARLEAQKKLDEIKDQILLEKVNKRLLDAVK